MAGLRILVVDDCTETAASMALLLGMQGHQVQIAPDGPTAIERARADKPDVVLLDIGLPGLNGYQLTPLLRKCVPDRPPLIVAVTGFGEDSDRRRSEEAGIDLHLVKPVEPLVLMSLLSRFSQVVA